VKSRDARSKGRMLSVAVNVEEHVDVRGVYYL